MKSSKIRSFEGLRGIAALLVVLYHVTYLHLFVLIKVGYLAVDLFFVLSGFVMCVSYDDRLSTIRDFRIFMIARFARLAPLLIFSYVVYFVIENIFRKSGGIFLPSILDIFATLSMTFGLGFPNIRVFNFSSWSVSTEFYTYIIFGSLWIIARGSWRIIFAAILASTGTAILFFIDFIINHCGVSEKACLDNVASLGAVIRCVSGFFLGVFAFQIRDHLRIKNTLSVHTVTIAAIFCSILIMWWSDKFGFLAFISPIAFAAVVILASTDSGPISLILNASVPQILGRLSYSLYLMHMPLLIYFHHGLEQYRGINFGVWLIVFLLALILFSIMTYKLIEIPAKKAIMKYIDGRYVSVDYNIQRETSIDHDINALRKLDMERTEARQSDWH